MLDHVHDLRRAQLSTTAIYVEAVGKNAILPPGCGDDAGKPFRLTLEERCGLLHTGYGVVTSCYHLLHLGVIP
jgi:hypothetical protein